MTTITRNTETGFLPFTPAGFADMADVLEHGKMQGMTTAELIMWRDREMKELQEEGADLEEGIFMVSALTAHITAKHLAAA